MSTRILYFSFGLFILLGISRCGGCNEPKVATENCPLKVLDLAYAASFCDQPSVVLDSWTCAMGLPAGDWPEGECFGDRSRIVSLSRPITGELFLNFYNAGGGDVTIQVLGRNSSGISVLRECATEKGLFGQLRTAVAPDYDDVFLRVEAVPNEKPGSIAAIEDKNSYVELTASDRLLELPELTDPDEIRAANLDGTPCLGNYTGRLIVSSCNRDIDLEAWAAELGLEIREVRKNTDGSSIGVVILPNSAGDPKVATAAVKQTKADVNTDGIMVEPDILFTISETSTLNPFPSQQTDVGKVIQEFIASCQPYERNRPASVAGTDGIRVAIIDSGVDPTGEFGTPFANHAYREATLGNLTSGSLGFDYNNATPTLTDPLFHGTSVAGILLSQYKGSQPLTLLHQKIFDERGVATYFGALVAIQEAIDAEVDLINMSWGIVTHEEPRALRCALERAAEAGVIMVTSAGNSSLNLDDDPQYPAAFAGTPGLESVISVAAYGPDGYRVDAPPTLAQPASFTNFSNSLVTLAAFQGALAPSRTGGVVSLDYLSGTSFSAPLVTATLATYLGNGISNPVERLLSPAVSMRAANLGEIAVDGRFLPACHDAAAEMP